MIRGCVSHLAGEGDGSDSGKKIKSEKNKKSITHPVTVTPQMSQLWLTDVPLFFPV
jgi:hypothetical protein